MQENVLIALKYTVKLTDINCKIQNLFEETDQSVAVLNQNRDNEVKWSLCITLFVIIPIKKYNYC